MPHCIEYIAALRGLTMLMVVLGHVPMYCYHNTAGGLSFSLVGSTFHLALFFFISGWFGWNHNIKDNYKKIWGKFMQLVVPTAMFYMLYCWLNGIDIVDNLWNDKYKAGYWFCIVLFCFYLTLATVQSLTRKAGKLGGVILLMFALIAIMFNSNTMTRWLSNNHVP